MPSLQDAEVAKLKPGKGQAERELEMLQRRIQRIEVRLLLLST